VYSQFLTFEGKFETLIGLEDGWDGLDAEQPNRESIELAKDVLLSCIKRGLLPNGASPSVEGGTSIYFIKGDKYADFEFFNNGEILAGLSDRVATPQIKELQKKDITATIDEFKQFLND